MRSLSLVIYFMSLFVLTGCTIETSMNTKYLLSTNVELASLGATIKGPEPIVGRNCFSQVGVPLMARFNTDAALLNALKKAPGQVGLVDVVVVSEVMVLGVYNRVCTEVRGWPLGDPHPTS